MATRPTREDAEIAVRVLLSHLGENPDRGGLLETPRRVVRSLEEMTVHRTTDGWELLDKHFELDDEEIGLGSYDQVILSRDIPFTSLCEHHMLPIIGVAHVAYIPKVRGRIVGLSKLARVVEIYSKRLQVQERLTQQIADAVQGVLNPRGVAVIIKASHSCQSMRGIRKSGSMVTSALYGYFKDDDKARAELMELIKL